MMRKNNLYLQNSWKYRHLLEELVRRDIKVKYRRSVLGLAWSILNPLLMMMVITAVFSTVFKFDVENFPAYYLTGSLIFNFVSEATNGAMRSILENSGLIKKVYLPKYVFPLEKVIFAFVNAIFSLIAVAIVFIIIGISPSWTMLLFPIPLIYTLIFSIGIGLILSAVNVFFRDMGHLYGVWLTAWMYLTPIIYPVEALPEAIRNILVFNPLFHYVNYFRAVMLYNAIPSMIDNLICLGISLCSLLLGVIIFKKQQDKFILYI